MLLFKSFAALTKGEGWGPNHFNLSPHLTSEVNEMSIFSWLSNAPDKAIDLISKTGSAVASGIDKIVLTEEEKQDFKIKKAELTAKAMESVIEIHKTIASESSIRSITRRMLAVSFIGVYLLLIVGASIVYQFSPEYASHLFKNADSMDTVVMTIVIFYFGYYAIGNLIKAKKE